MLTEQDVKSLMRYSSLKSCVLDPMPSTLVSRCDVLLPVFTRLINMSFKSGQFPVAWKEALVLPLLKKPSLYIIFKNFSPVNNLPFASKADQALWDTVHVTLFDQSYVVSARAMADIIYVANGE